MENHYAQAAVRSAAKPSSNEINTDPDVQSPQVSRVRPPSKLPTVAGRLAEISESDGNARAQTMLPPPQSVTNAMKHKPSNLPEPAPKRKTLVERAGEATSLPSSRSTNGSVRGAAAAGLRNQHGNHIRNISNNSSTTSRTASGMSMFSASVGSGSRPPSSHSSHRPVSTTSHVRSGSRAAANSATSFDHHAGADDDVTTATIKTWDPSSCFQKAEQFYGLREGMEQSIAARNSLQEHSDWQKTRIHELESSCSKQAATNDSLHTTINDLRSQLSAATDSLHTMKNDLQARNHSLQISYDSTHIQLEETKMRLQFIQTDLDGSRREHRNDVDDLNRKHRNEISDLREEMERLTERTRREADSELARSQKSHSDELAALERRLRAEAEEVDARRTKEVERLEDQLSVCQQKAATAGADQGAQIEQLRSEVTRLESLVEQGNLFRKDLETKLSEALTTNVNLEASMQAMRGKIHFLESDSQAQSQEFVDLKRREQEAIATAEETLAKLRVEESLRRKLHNQVQELKGNIRVFCRVRPTLESDGKEAEPAKISFPDTDADSKELVVLGPEQKSALGNITASKNPFSFDRVFGPSSQNADIFGEISQLVQSALDGYNVCIFCYGQTGSGKTHTMSHPTEGMIPLAVQQIYTTAAGLEEKGWKYTMEGTFVEVYNENLNDLLGTADELDKKKLEVRLDTAKGRTVITNAETMTLETPAMLESLLKRAAKNRSVAATKANERSSRSHSVFILKLTGTNSVTGEHSVGTLNLVDLAGSERLAHSGATGERLKETQNINRSLSCLGDVIGALGSGKENAHVPYRNSKLTYLLQYSLGGNSKTLMFVMCSPLTAHLSETLTSLRFATKVHNTHIGTAKRQARVKDL